jgi:hypothetical protein
MKEAWCLATSRADTSATEVTRLYGKRFTIEETFRDTKDVHFGMGLKATHIGDSSRRDRLLLLGAVAHALLTLLGDAGERAGLDRLLKTNTSKKRQRSLYNQGCFWYDAQPTTRREYRSRRTAKYNHPSLVEMYVMSPASTWFGAGALKSRSSRFGAMRFVCRESVVLRKRRGVWPRSP